MFNLKVENTKIAGHNVKPRLPGKMCTSTSVVRSQHAIAKNCIPRTSISEYMVNTIRPSGLVGVFIQRTGFVFYRTL